MRQGGSSKDGAPAYGMISCKEKSVEFTADGTCTRDITTSMSSIRQVDVERAADGQEVTSLCLLMVSVG